ncbi:MAG: hypothetical protein ABSG75_10625 [Syntrophales bacterium]|jgi:antitoxin component YwqK of YwqJK toxin-antitoxin module
MKIMKTLFFQSLAITIVLAGFTVYAADQAICNSEATVVFHKNGSVKACQLKDDYNENDIRCKNESTITFYSNGNLESCVLSTPAAIGENKCKDGGLISFYVDGQLKSCVKPED